MSRSEIYGGWSESFARVGKSNTCMDISVCANTIQMPADFFSKAHIQTFQVTKHSPIDAVHFVTFHKSAICLLCHSSIRVSTKACDVFIKKPALVLVHYSEE